ncbi:hypothetical protein HMPREF1092_00730 [Clostridium thermobutyricum]|uniref:Pentapeptide repeat protein n=1 Tax=Clostridium thermobutyricum TaxID=29372 RepID=N9XUZ7_9CLOT|nr:hypothetical protein HMPREF1092_00730 [Clostridium thermobutyricum]
MAKKIIENLKYNNTQKTNKNFMYRDLKRSNCYNTNFSGSNFSFASFRGAHFKSCDFFDCKFEWTEFIGTNLKKSKFKKSIFKNVVFEGVNLDGVDFLDAKFENVILVNTNIEKAKNLFLPEETRVFEIMPELNISDSLKKAINLAMENKYIKNSRTLDTKEGEINPISVMLLLENFNEKSLIKGLNLMNEKVEKDFSTLSYIIKTIKDYAKLGLL